MSATATATKAPKFGEPILPEAKKVQPIAPDRMVSIAYATGEMMSVTLEGTQTIEEGEQDTNLWRHLGPKLSNLQWLRIGNDAQTMRRIMEVEAVFGSPGTGLRSLILSDLLPPKFFDRQNEQLRATGEWRTDYFGPYWRNRVITPGGTVRHAFINSETEAKNICHRESGNPRPIGA